MCGIIGFTGREKAVPVVMEGLSSLEYRGYDSAGIGYFEDGTLRLAREKGRLENLRDKIASLGEIHTSCAIGHTRWATHGAPSRENAHPHGTENVLAVHNGIIENYGEIKDFLAGKGYEFASVTDTEVAVKLIDYYFGLSRNPAQAIRCATDRMRGAFAFGMLFSGFEGKIYAVRQDNSLVAAVTEKGAFITSDISSILQYTNEFYEIDEGEIAVVEEDGVTFLQKDGTSVRKEASGADWSAGVTHKEGFDHYMLKEIHEEPEAIYNTLCSLGKGGEAALGGIREEILRNVEKIHIAACGTAYHAGLVGKHAVEKLSGVPVNVYYASEFRYGEPLLGKKDVVVLVSQSGETADTLGALRLAKDRGIHTLAIVNAPGSAIAREAESVLYTRAGPEISVASTKAYHVQLAAMYLLAIKLAEHKGKILPREGSRLAQLLAEDVPGKVGEVLDMKDVLHTAAKKYTGNQSMFFIGRGVDCAQCREAALKLKEISYIHCEAYAAGELKHGTISLIEEGTPVVAVITAGLTVDKMISNIQEVKARGARVIVFVTENTALPTGLANDIIYLPGTEELFMPFVCAAATQLFAYYVALELGRDVDKPRNLAKSVTVE